MAQANLTFRPSGPLPWPVARAMSSAVTVGGGPCQGSSLPCGSPDHPPEIVCRLKAIAPASRPGRGVGAPSPAAWPLPAGAGGIQQASSGGSEQGIPGSVAWMLLDEDFSGITDGDLRMRPTVVVHPRPYGLRVDPFHRV